MGQDEKGGFIYLDGEGNSFFGFALRSLLALAAVGAREEDYRNGFRARQLGFLNDLLNSGDERLTYEIRILSQPNPELYSRGRISIAILEKLKGGSAKEPERARLNLMRLLLSTFLEHEFSSIPAEEIPSLLDPFQPRSIVEIRRRFGFEPLDTLAGKPPIRRIGFSAGAAAESRQTEKLGPVEHSVFHVFPLLPGWTSHNVLSSLLLFEENPIAISFRLKPTRLSPSEQRFLEAQIASCETAIQGGGSFPSLRLQADAFARHQTRRLFGLRDNTALGCIQIASPGPIPSSINDAVGSLVTEPSGFHGRSEGSEWESFFSGGYEIIEDSSSAQKRNFISLNIQIRAAAGLSKAMARIPFLYDSIESAAFFRFPHSTDIPPMGIPIKSWKTAPPPDNLPTSGCRLGIAPHLGVTQPVWVGSGDRQRHVYVVGQTGAGKTTLLKTMILEDIRAGEGLCLIDPHGDLYKEILAGIPDHRIDDVILIDPTDAEYPVALNMLENPSGDQSFFLSQEFVGIIRRLMHDEYGSGTQMIGPIFFQHMRMNLLLAMSNPDDPGTLIEFYNIFQIRDYWKHWLPLRSHDPVLERWVKTTLPRIDYTKPTSEGESMGGYVGSKFQGFIFDPMLRNIFGQKRSVIDFRKAMDEGRILLINLAKGELTEENSRFLGMIILAKLMAAAMSRVGIPKGTRRQFNLYVDEFQSLATNGFVTLLSEARKFGVSLILANQFLTQIKDPQILQAVFGNVGTTISFRLGPEDAEMMERKFLPAFNRADLINIPNWNAYITTMVHGQVVRPFSFETVLDPCREPPDRAEKVRDVSRARYTRPRAEAEKEIEAGLNWSGGRESKPHDYDEPKNA